MKLSRTARPTSALLAAVAALVIVCGSARGTVTAVAGGTAAPAATLGFYVMKPFSADTVNPADTETTSIPTPLGSPISLSSSLEHTTVGDDWNTWSNGYTGDVYADFGATSFAAGVTPAVTSDLTDTLTLPTGTGAFYMYFEPVDFGTFAMTVTANDGTTATQEVNGDAGADYFGFYAAPGQSLATLTVDSSDADGFAVGEFGIAKSTAVPEPATAALAATAAAGLLAGRRRPRLAAH